MGDSISEGTVAGIEKQPGDAVSADEVVAQIETDKVTLEVRAPSAGTLSELFVKEGDTVEPGTPIASLEEGEESKAKGAEEGGKGKGKGKGKSKSQEEAPEKKQAQVPKESEAISIPSLGDSVSEGTVAGLLKSPGDACQADEPIMHVETDKVTIDVKAPEAGTIASIDVADGDTVMPGQQVATFSPGQVEDVQKEEVKAAEKQPKEEEAGPSRSEAAAPKKGNEEGKGGKGKEDGKEAKRKEEEKKQEKQQGASPLRGERRERISRLRMRVAERLKGAQNTYAMLSTFNEADMTNLMQLRKDLKDDFQEKHGVKLGMMSCFVKASAQALEEFPEVNAVIDGEEIVYRDQKDISIAVGTKKGLVVPVLRDTTSMTFSDVERKVAEYGQKARDGTLSIDEMSGGTFTISNGGVYGSLLSTPIINPPQSAILGMHSIVQRPWVVDGGKIEPRPIMNLALTYDHRLIDGREAVLFLNRVKEQVEDPRRILLGI